MNNNTNDEPYVSCGFKEKIKIKYEATKRIVGKFPNRIAALKELLTNALSPLDWAPYCTLTTNQQLVWKLKDDKLNQAIYFLMNLKNETAKRIYVWHIFK